MVAALDNFYFSDMFISSRCLMQTIADLQAPCRLSGYLFLIRGLVCGPQERIVTRLQSRCFQRCGVCCVTPGCLPAQRASGLALSGVSRVAHTQELWSVCGFQEVLGLQHSHAVTDPRDTP